MEFKNDYEDASRAAAYARLEFPGTYHLAFRDIPGMLRRLAPGPRALDFGCGAGRSTRFLTGLDFRPTGIDISEEMLKLARGFDPKGDYRRVEDGGSFPFPDGEFNLVFSAFTFDNIPNWEKKTALFREIRRVLKPEGRLLNLVSTPDIYVNEWASFSTRNFPENRQAKTGDPVLIVNTAIDEPRPVIDILWTDADYRETYSGAGLELLEMRKLLARPDENKDWINETRISPWCLYVLRPDRPDVIRPI